MAITLKDVAEMAGVSRSAVSRTFTEGASVSAKTRKKVEAAAQSLGYQPNALASSLTTGRTKLIGLIATNFRNPLFLEVFDRFTLGLQDRGMRPLLINMSKETDPTEPVKLLRQYSVDAAIVASSTLPPQFARAIRDAKIPVVNSFGRASDAPDVDVVGIDNEGCGRMAAQTFAARGYAKIAFLGGPEFATSTQDRLKGFTAAVAETPGLSMTHSFADDYTFSAGRRAMNALLSNPAEAYFCGDDVISIGAKSAIEDAGLEVPEDIGLLGLNDMEMASWDNISLTTIHQPIERIISHSIDRIMHILNDPNAAPESHSFACEIRERKTLRPLSD